MEILSRFLSRTRNQNNENNSSETNQGTWYDLWIPNDVERILFDTADTVGIPETTKAKRMHLVVREALESYVSSVRRGDFRKPRLYDIKGIILEYPTNPPDSSTS